MCTNLNCGGNPVLSSYQKGLWHRLCTSGTCMETSWPLYCIVLYCIYYTDMVIYYKLQCLKIYILSNPAPRNLSVSLK